MKQWKQIMCAMTAAALMAVACAGSAFAAEDRTKISSITVTINADIEVGDNDANVTASVSSSHYDVVDVEVTNDDGYWSAGDVPKVEITLEADDDYYFGSMSSSSVTLKGDGATYSSSRRTDSNSTLILTVKLDAIEGTYELGDCYWIDDSSPVAIWEDDENTDSYQVRLYRNGSAVATAETTTNRYYDFGSLITRTGDYTFRVRAYKSSSKHGEWYESDELTVDDYLLSRIQSGNYSRYSCYSYGGGPSTGTSGNPYSSGPTGIVNSGWQWDTIGGWWYLLENGSYPSNGWLLIDNVWYCFDSVGYMRTGWIQSENGNWYYCDPTSGAMWTNAWTPDGYYVNSDGIWVPDAVYSW